MTFHRKIIPENPIVMPLNALWKLVLIYTFDIRSFFLLKSKSELIHDESFPLPTI